MADINDIEAAQTVKIVGSDATGVEQTPVQSNPDGSLRTIDVLNLGTGTQAPLTVGTTVVEVRVGATPLANRRVVTVYNNSNTLLYWGFSNSVTVSSGTPIFKKQMFTINVGPGQSVFLIAATAGNNARITEA